VLTRVRGFVELNFWNILVACNFRQTDILTYLYKLTFCHLPQLLSIDREDNRLCNVLALLTENLVCCSHYFSRSKPLIVSRDSCPIKPFFVSSQ
jgi:hypothetical protein